MKLDLNESILSDYEDIHRQLGDKVWNALDEYCQMMNGEIFLSDVLYRKSEWDKFEKWYDKKYKKSLHDSYFEKKKRVSEKFDMFGRYDMFSNEGKDPYSAIERDKKQVIHKIKRMFDETAKPLTSWENIVDNLLTEFESFCGDYASAEWDENEETIEEKFYSGEMDEYDVKERFIDFVDDNEFTGTIDEYDVEYD